MFLIEINRLRWIDDSNDNVEDLCLHGNVIATIGQEQFECDCTVSATALYLLKTLTENHRINEDNQMLPCCGFSIYPREDNNYSDLVIVGCPNGIDWSVIHSDNGVKIITEAGNEMFVEINEYRKIVYNFVDKVEQFYKQSPKRKLSGDDFDKHMYYAFWEEWKSRRNMS